MLPTTSANNVSKILKRRGRRPESARAKAMAGITIPPERPAARAGRRLMCPMSLASECCDQVGSERRGMLSGTGWRDSVRGKEEGGS
ncbi:hypothetical protein GCM10009839_55480 [Catenulispora yoronensis]|uniref:Uncharacterized protein n=1 Tax=Catenulispora yoronensis TaxID=450799 RepID=A0ABP5GHL1_9ACTN